VGANKSAVVECYNGPVGELNPDVRWGWRQCRLLHDPRRHVDSSDVGWWQIASLLHILGTLLNLTPGRSPL
jgi:hypothetical protein